MSARPSQPNDPKLEDQLRNLILGNVRITEDEPSEPNRSWPPGFERSATTAGREHYGSSSHRYRGGPNLWASRSTGQSGHEVANHTYEKDGYLTNSQPLANLHSDSNAAQNASDMGNRSRGNARAGSGLSQGVRHSARFNYNRQGDSGLGTTSTQNGSFDNSRDGTARRTEARQNSRGRPPRGSRQLYNPGPRPPPPAIFIAQCEYLDQAARTEIAKVQMGFEEFQSKDGFRDMLERGFQQTLIQMGLPGNDILSLQGFGSFHSGFATAGSDVDLAIVLHTLPNQSTEDAAKIAQEMPRVLEKALLDAGFGARLLDKTRVPIIKTCQAPTPELLQALREARSKWDALPDDEKYSSGASKEARTEDTDWKWKEDQSAAQDTSGNETNINADLSSVEAVKGDPVSSKEAPIDTSVAEEVALTSSQNDTPSQAKRSQPKHKNWLRERPRGPLDFPKEGVGIQADINFSNALALQNTELLRCYSLCDPRVQPMVLFIKAWAKRRKINSSYHGTLSSYGYVLMVLHFLVNVVKPPVLPNIQLTYASMAQGLRQATIQLKALPKTGAVCEGYSVNFWRDAEEIKKLAASGLLTQNAEPLGVLLRNFFHYYAHQGHSVIGRGFQWTAEVLSLRTSGGLLTKEEKGWTGAKTTTTENREVRHRYLFAIEDPFELEHNVARTVTHNGIVAIRDEFRRAWRILTDVGNGWDPQQGDLFDEIVENTEPAADAEAEGVAGPPAA